MATKRSGTGSIEPPPSKRTKKESKAEIEKQIAHNVETAENLQALLSKALAAEPPNNLELLYLEMWAFSVRLEFDDLKLEKSIQEPPPVSHPQYAVLARNLHMYATQWVELQKTLASIRAPPSQFANSAWPGEQAKYSDILCLRPPERTGVPLSTLHEAFHRFQHDAMVPFQESADTIPAARAAGSLARTMGHSFEDKTDRTDAFNLCIDPLFTLNYWRMQVPVSPTSERCIGTIDAAFYIGDSLAATVLREDKKELGHAGDPYMQIARGYHMYVKMLEDRKKEPAINAILAHGVPMFLLCVQGPVLSVAGAFYDGKAAIVEPLCPSPWMLASPGLRRYLSQVLYALQQGVKNIQTSLPLAPTPLIPSVPRLYPTCRKVDGTEAPITFLSVFHASWDKPIFNAKLDGTGDVLAKMTDRAYGITVHEFLGERGFAPKLLGVCTLDDRPTVYVMEKLDNTWMTLADWEGSIAPLLRSTVRPQVQNQINHIIGLLEEKGYVHGDLRTTNIMIRKESNELKVIDFDWAGDAEHTCYPVDRNDEIQEWPKNSMHGGAIAIGDDRALVNNWWATFLT